MSDWTDGYAKAWQATWNEPHMQEGLKRLKEMAEVDPVVLGPVMGTDALVVSACEHHRKVGQSDILKCIERLNTANAVLKQLPPPFTREARGEPPLK